MAKYTSEPFGVKFRTDLNRPDKDQFATTYDILSEGPIEGLSNGLASIFINDVPLIQTQAEDILKPRRFSWITDPELGSRDGFLAHEVSPIIPHCISGEKDAVKEDGNIQTQTMDYSQVTPLLTAALQEAISEIEILKAEVAALKSN